MSESRSLEVKVGALILVSLGVLGAFILVMGGISFESTYPLYVDFDNPGGLLTGAAVRVGGVKVGSVKALEFLGGKIDPKTGRRVVVRVQIAVQKKVEDSIHTDAAFYVTTQGLLGEQFLAIDPGSPDKGPVPEGSEVKGIDPPRLDLFLAKAYDLLDTTVDALKNNREALTDIINNTSGLLKGLNFIVSGNRERIERTLANVEDISVEAKQLTHDARVNYVDNPKLMQTVDRVSDLVARIQEDAGPMLKDAREALANLDRISSTVGDPAEQAKIRKTLDDVAQLAERANATAADAQAIVTHIKSGKGTVGALVMDEEIYDDMQEMVRDLKHNPWKFLWRE
ncbi:MAG TPA: MlaD family protein [Polyangiaceae bacterium]|jgi:phospholipid/cholesterol/gamma-HCH transport system substrate-binding protein|nr:MlaD family protein [Polyangiaceae bacterium]